MAFRDALLCLLIVIYSTSAAVSADSIQGCGGFVEASSSLIKSRKPTDAKFDYSHITVELRTVDGLVKDRTQCTPNGYYFIPVYDKGSFVVKINGPEGWSWDPDKVPVVVDHTGCNANEDINFQFTGFTISGRVAGAVGGESCSVKNGGPANVNVELLSPMGDLISSVLTSPVGGYSFTNIIPGNYKLRASHPDVKVEVRGSTEVELGFGNNVVDDIFFVPGYDIRGFVVSQPGYHLKPVGPYSFSCQKLSQISVHIFSKEDAKEPFSSVLLSLSGDNGYRNISFSGAGGIFLFDNLFPGSFYLRPLLKEYAFSPPAQAIELGSGEAREVIFQAVRVAYSATGTVSLLSGQPKEGVSVEARSESKGYYEETTTDSSGSYRLRGLLPDTAYLIKVVKKDDLGSARIERASPESVSVKVGSEDIRGLDFLVFEEPEMTILSCHVEGERIGELHSHLLVEIKSATDPSKIESVFPLPLSHFFQVKDLPKGKHLLQLQSGLPSSTHKFESEIIEVDLEKHTQIHVGPLRYKIEEDHHKQIKGFIPKHPGDLHSRIHCNSKERSAKANR